jgi:phosphoserine phosphatase RsbU/P
MRLRLRIEPPNADAWDCDVEGSELVIGRAAGVGLVLSDSTISRQHARLVRRGDEWWVEELSARNPTFVNTDRLVRPTRLSPGDRLTLGATVLKVVMRDAIVPAAAVPSSGGDDRQAARLGILNDVHRALAAAISLPELLDLILERTFAVLRPEEGVILLKRPDGSLERAATRTRAGAGGEVFISRRLVDEVAGKGKPVLVLDAALDERLSGSDSIISSGIRSVVAAPLADPAGAIGLVLLSSRAGVRQFTEEDLDLLVSLASAAALRVRNVALTEEAAARRVLERELALAHDMQMSMLPRRMPDRPEIAVAASLKPARSVGGDLYDFSVDGDRLWFIVADVAGKGVGAALYMAVVKTLFRASAHGGAALADVVGRMNQELCRDNDSMMFITALVGTLSLATGEMAIVDAGHNPAMVIDPTGRIDAAGIPKSVAFGVIEDYPFQEGRLALGPGSTLLLYTDGATDARNVAGEIFGEERLLAALRRGGPAPDALVASIVSTVDAFAAGAAPEDDLTLLAIQYLGV